MRLSGKKILLGVSGSIAAYKSAELIRLFKKEGAQVQVIMTKPAHDFVTPLTLATLSQNPVLTEFSNPVSGTWNNHVELGLWADAFIIAPATAHTLAKLAHGYCDDLLSATYLSARCSVFIAPAMDLDMFAHGTTTDNLRKLSSLGNYIIGPANGELASGLSGAGRMMEPVEICDYLVNAISTSPVINGKKILITAGGTREAIDPVRFISNHSSGKMGVAIAEEFALRGGEVTLICGPGVLKPTAKNITCIDVESASDMYRACMNIFPDARITIMAAAVADYTPEKVSGNKIKKSGDDLQLKLKATRDIISEMGSLKTPEQVLIGFALETDNELKNASGKLHSKNLDFIILNSINDPGAGFNSDTNKITIIGKNMDPIPYNLKPKRAVARDIVEFIITKYTK